uniref:H15 domain-containing protein n=1 Tax=Rhabditophanes sp. KR3021 TaxID=114890 RepID=A0AC35TPN0_9BILA
MSNIPKVCKHPHYDDMVIEAIKKGIKTNQDTFTLYLCSKYKLPKFETVKRNVKVTLNKLVENKILFISKGVGLRVHYELVADPPNLVMEVEEPRQLHIRIIISKKTLTSRLIHTTLTKSIQKNTLKVNEARKEK